MSLCFEAPAAGGPLRLVLPAPSTGPADVLDAAQALAAAEPWLLALEAWWQTALDPQPVPAEHRASGACLWVENPTRPGLRLGLPWAQLLAAAPPPAPLPWHWPSLTWQVVLATYAQDPLPCPAHAAPAAGALLLPPAFEGGWRVQLRCAAPALLAEAEWAGPGHALQLCGPPEADPGGADSLGPGGAPCWVELCSPWVATVPQLLGWTAAPAAPLGDQARLCRAGTDESRTGTVAPALGGAALWLGAGGETPATAEARQAPWATPLEAEVAAWT